MTIIYRILSFLINFFAFLIAIALFVIIPVALAVPAMWLPTFLLIAIVLYSWFSTRFTFIVLIRRQSVKHSLRDWIRVNGFVAIAFSFLNILNAITILKNPSQFLKVSKETMSQWGEQFQKNFKPESLNTVIAIMLVYFVALFIHVLWTFALMKKHQEFFKQPE